MNAEKRRANLRKLLHSRFNGMQTELATTLGLSTGRVSQLLTANGTFGEKSARMVEERCGLPLGWLDAIDDAASPQQMMAREAEAHYLNLQPFTVPQELSWEDVMQMDKLPATFVLAMPDDALAPRVLRGTRLIFDTAVRPQPGTGVLVLDAVGRRYVRRYAEGTGGTWLAQAVHDAYATLESARDGLKLLAVMTGRMDGAI